MDNKEAIIQETIKLIEEKGERLDEITVREHMQKSQRWLRSCELSFWK